MKNTNYFTFLWIYFIKFCSISCFNYGRNSDLRLYIYNDTAWNDISGASLVRRDRNEILDNLLNNGAGPVVDLENGLYHTDQYQLFSMIYYRALTDPRRTLNPDLATTFIIPYDFANDCAFYKRCNNNINSTCFDFRKCPLAPSVNELLRKSPYFQRKHGSDHLLIIGMNYAMNHYILKPKCKSLLRDVCFNCTKLAIDDYSFMFADDEGGASERGDNWHAIPFPSNFHWNRNFQGDFPWVNRNRSILVSYVGSSRSFYTPARRLRTSIIFYCEKHPGLCFHQSYSGSSDRSTFKKVGYNPLDISARSIFCFQPIGDLMTRKGLFDSLLQGCIPVIFDSLTAPVMYTWHWNESFWNDISVQLPFRSTAFKLEDPINVLQALFINNRTVIERKQNLIKDHVFELHYALDGRYYDYATSGSEVPRYWPLHTDGTPKRDAYDISMDLVLGWHSYRELDIRNATIPECYNGAVVDSSSRKCVRIKT